MAWARLFNLFGPGEQPARLVPTVIRRLSQREPVPCSDGLQLRDYLPVAEAARALAAVVGSAVEGPINIGSGDGITVRELAIRIADLIGSRGLLQFGALPRRAGEPDALVASITRLTDEVGFTPDADLPAALQQTVSWWLSRGLQAI
jgi:nucleoside-diphosphate-sugar epimerase